MDARGTPRQFSDSSLPNIDDVVLSARFCALYKQRKQLARSALRAKLESLKIELEEMLTQSSHSAFALRGLSRSSYENIHETSSSLLETKTSSSLLSQRSAECSSAGRVSWKVDNSWPRVASNYSNFDNSHESSMAKWTSLLKFVIDLQADFSCMSSDIYDTVDYPYSAMAGAISKSTSAEVGDESRDRINSLHPFVDGNPFQRAQRPKDAIYSMCHGSEKPEFLQKNLTCIATDFELSGNILSSVSGEVVSRLGTNKITLWPSAKLASVEEELTSEKADILLKNETSKNSTANRILTEDLFNPQRHLKSSDERGPVDLPSPRTSACIGHCLAPSSNESLYELGVPIGLTCMPRDPCLCILISQLQCGILCLNMSRKKFQRRTYFGSTSLQDERRSATALWINENDLKVPQLTARLGSPPRDVFQNLGELSGFGYNGFRVEDSTVFSVESRNASSSSQVEIYRPFDGAYRRESQFESASRRDSVGLDLNSAVSGVSAPLCLLTRDIGSTSAFFSEDLSSADYVLTTATASASSNATTTNINIE